MFGAFAFSLGGKETADVTLLRGLGAPFQVLPSGEVSNQIRIKIANRSAAGARIPIASRSSSRPG